MTEKTAKPNCYDCKHRMSLIGNCHSACAKKDASVIGSSHGKKNGWFYWPYNYDPTWLISCDSFSAKGAKQ